MKELKSKSGAVDIMTVCLVMILCIIGITVLGITLRMAKHEKYIIDDAVVTAATSCQVSDLYHYATTEKLLFDSGENGAYDISMEEGTRKALEVAYYRFKKCLSESVGLNISLEPETNNYIKKVSINEFTIYNVLEDGIYTCSYRSERGYEDTATKKDRITIETKNSVLEVKHTSVFVDAVFLVEVYGKEYSVPIKEYVYSN